MNKGLLIVGAGEYSVVAYEIAKAMNCFEKIDFIDDSKTSVSNGKAVLGCFNDICTLSKDYSHAIVAIGNPHIRLSLLQQIENNTNLEITTLISPQAFVAPSATIQKGSFVEPLAVIHSMASIKFGCIISAGAVVNHSSICEKGVHIDCNAVVSGNCVVPPETKLESCQVYK